MFLQPIAAIREFFWQVIPVNGRSHLIQAYDVVFIDPKLPTKRYNAQYIPSEIIKDFWENVAKTVKNAEAQAENDKEFVASPDQIHDRKCHVTRQQLEAAGHQLDRGYIGTYLIHNYVPLKYTKTLGAVPASCNLANLNDNYMEDDDFSDEYDDDVEMEDPWERMPNRLRSLSE